VALVDEERVVEDDRDEAVALRRQSVDEAGEAAAVMVTA